MKKFLSILVLLLTLIFPVYADIVWPSLYIAGGMLSVKFIVAGFFAELIFVKYFVKLNLLKAFIVTFVMNLVTCLLGILLIPISGLLIEFITPFGTTFHWSHWVLSYLAVVLINTCIEGTILKLWLKQTFKSIFWWLFIANLISVLLCMFINGPAMQSVKL